MSLKFALLGATGQTGKPLIGQALDRGHNVKALVRNPDKLADLKHDNLEVVTCDIFSEDDLKLHLADVDVVMSTLGFSLLSRPVTYVHTYGSRLTVACN